MFLIILEYCYSCYYTSLYFYKNNLPCTLPPPTPELLNKIYQTNNGSVIFAYSFRITSKIIYGS